jgi:condensin complex subunit 1
LYLFSVVQEVIEFFVMVFQFGVPQALFGVRRMLPLIWSKEPGVREAVLNAYRQLYLNPKGDSARYMGFLVFVNFSFCLFVWFGLVWLFF